MTFGGYMTRVFAGAWTFLSPGLRPLERFVYWCCGVDETEEQSWRTYAVSMLFFGSAKEQKAEIVRAPAETEMLPAATNAQANRQRYPLIYAAMGGICRSAPGGPGGGLNRRRDPR